MQSVESDRREGKGRHCWLRDILECHISHLAARTIWRKVFKRTSILRGFWFGVVWTGWSSIFPKHPFRQVFNLLFTLFYKSFWHQIASAACNCIYSVPPTSSDDLCFPFCLIFIGWGYIMYVLLHVPTMEVCWTSSVASFSTLGSLIPKVSTSL